MAYMMRFILDQILCGCTLGDRMAQSDLQGTEPTRQMIRPYGP